MEQDRKEYRRNTIKAKKITKGKDYSINARDKNKIQKAFKNKKREIAEEEIWEQWRDEIY